MLTCTKHVFQAANIITLYDVSNIWHIPLLLRVSDILQNLYKKDMERNCSTTFPLLSEKTTPRFMFNIYLLTSTM